MLRHVVRAAAAACGGAQTQRQLSAAAAATVAPAAAQAVQVPIAVFGPAGKYASALYVAAFRGKQLDNVEKELEQLAQVTGKDKVFGLFLKDPAVPKDVRTKAVEEILGEAKFSPITKNLLALLSDNGRLTELPKISSAYSDIMMAHRGEVKATVTAALEMTPAEFAEVKDALTTFLQPGQKLVLTQKVDRSIIGGLTVDIGDKHIDLSIRARIKQLETVLSEGV